MSSSKPGLKRPIIFAGGIVSGIVYLMMLGLTSLLGVPATDIVPTLLSLGVAAMSGGHFAAAMADEAKLRHSLVAGLYFQVALWGGLAMWLCGQLLDETRSAGYVNLLAAYGQLLWRYVSSWRVMAMACTCLIASLGGGLLELAITACARWASPRGRWTYRTEEDRRIPALEPWRHPLLAGLYRFVGWVFILSCWTPLFFPGTYFSKGLAVAQFFVMGRVCGALAKKRTARSALDFLSRDGKPAIVYLRSFRHDGRRVEEGAWHDYTRNVFGLLTETVEERLSRVLRRFGSFVAIGKPGEVLPEIGAARMYVSDDDWQAVVSDLLKMPRTVALVQAGDTQGIRWELSQIGRELTPAQVIVFLPFGLWGSRRKRDELYAAFRTMVEECLPTQFPPELRHSCFIYFSAEPTWQARVLGRREKPPKDHPLRPILRAIQRQKALWPRKMFSILRVIAVLTLLTIGLFCWMVISRVSDQVESEKATSPTNPVDTPAEPSGPIEPGPADKPPVAQELTPPEAPKAYVRKAFAFNYPATWVINEKLKNHDPDHYFSIHASDSSMIIFIIYDAINDPAEMLANMVRAQEENIPGAARAEFKRWGKYDGVGAVLRGKVQGVQESAIRIFAFNAGGRTFVITELLSEAERPRFAPGFRMIERSFEAKAPDSVDQPRPITPKAFARKSFRFNYPASWTVDEKDEDHDPDHLFSIDASESFVIMFIIMDAMNDPAGLLARMEQAQKKNIPDAARTEFKRWGKYDGAGAVLKGKLQGILESTFRIFVFNAEGKTFVITEEFADRERSRLAPGYRMIEDSFESIK